MSRRQKSSNPRRRVSGKSGLREWFRAFVLALAILLLLRFFAFEMVSIKTGGMEGTLLKGDVVWVNKYRYGSRMPLRIFPQSWVNLLFSTDSIPPVRHLPYWRGPSSAEVEHGDIVYFNTPGIHYRAIDQRPRKIKRIVSLPGDEVKKQNGKLFVNGQSVAEPVAGFRNYKLSARSGIVNDDFIQELGVGEIRKGVGKNNYVISLSKSQADSLTSRHGIIRLIPDAGKECADLPLLFGKSSASWTCNDFGSLKVPYKGMTIDFKHDNFDKYIYTIFYHERQKIFARNDSVFINGKYVDSYTFTMNYYYVLGDNMHNTSDSRHWGLLPSNHLIGKVTHLVGSFDKSASLIGKLRYDRFFYKPE